MRLGIATLLILAAALTMTAPRPSMASVAITGAVPAGAKYYLLTTFPVTGSEHWTLKFSFQTLTAGAALSLCAASEEQFKTNACEIELAHSVESGPGKLVIVDQSQLSGRVLFIRRDIGAAQWKFMLNVE